MRQICSYWNVNYFYEYTGNVYGGAEGGDSVSASQLVPPFLRFISSVEEREVPVELVPS